MLSGLIGIDALRHVLMIHDKFTVGSVLIVDKTDTIMIVGIYADHNKGTIVTFFSSQKERIIELGAWMFFTRYKFA